MWPLFTTFQRDFTHLEFKTKQTCLSPEHVLFPKNGRSSSLLTQHFSEPKLLSGTSPQCKRNAGADPFPLRTAWWRGAPGAHCRVSWKGHWFSNKSILTSELTSSPSTVSHMFQVLPFPREPQSLASSGSCLKTLFCF